MSISVRQLYITTIAKTSRRAASLFGNKVTRKIHMILDTSRVTMSGQALSLVSKMKNHAFKMSETSSVRRVD